MYNFKTIKLSFKYPKQKSYLHFFVNYITILKHLTYPSSILKRNRTYFFDKLFYNFKTFNISFKYPKQKSYLLFNNFKIFILSLKYSKHKYYLPFFINYFYNFKIFTLSLKYVKQKYYLFFFINYFIILKHLTYHSSILKRNPTYFFW